MRLCFSREGCRSRDLQPSTGTISLRAIALPAAMTTTRAPHNLYARTSTGIVGIGAAADALVELRTYAAATKRGQRHERQGEDGPQRNSSAGSVAVREPERHGRPQQRQNERHHAQLHLRVVPIPGIYSPSLEHI